MSEQPEGFREIEHTADWELLAWGTDLPSLFEQSARGMYTLCGTRWLGSSSQDRKIEIKAVDHENLLVNFLSELLYIYEQEQVGFNQFDLQITGNSLQASLGGSAVSVFEKEIKAVTYHNLKIRHSKSGWEVNIVFDV